MLFYNISYVCCFASLQASTEELSRIRASLPSRRTTKRHKKRGLGAYGGDKAGALGEPEDDDVDEDEDLNLLDDNA